MPKPSDNELLRKLSKILKSTGSETQSISASADPNTDPFTIEFSGSRAVDDCVKAYNQAFRKTLATTTSEYDARKAGARAYRQAIPALHGTTNIADFIACVGHALVLGCIEGNEATRLLYAAQVAHAATPRPTRETGAVRRVGRPPRNPEPYTSDFVESVPAACEHIEYLGPNDGWAGIDDPGLRAWYVQHYPRPNPQEVETQNPPVND